MLLKRRWPSTFLEKRLFLSSTGTSMSRTKSCVSNETSRHCGNSWTSQNPVCRTKLHTLSEVFNLTGEPELAGFGLSGEHRKTLETIVSWSLERPHTKRKRPQATTSKPDSRTIRCTFNPLHWKGLLNKFELHIHPSTRKTRLRRKCVAYVA